MATNEPKPLTQQLRAAIAGSGMSGYRLAKESGVAEVVIWRFMKGQRDLRMATVDRLGRVLGLEFRVRQAKARSK